MDEGIPQLPGFQAKSQVLEIHRHEKHFEVSNNKESHKVKVLALIYFSTQDKVGRNLKGRGKKTPPASSAGVIDKLGMWSFLGVFKL
jgi:hypothetical protein